ncbi:hypothetical protein THAOC_33267 [Thalassiosira oceanica]|uniref:Uncharacterized protein n=1 Tax=Thalassiosira oceanica TaxID=159749 RepID=K0RG63_THAOC|nr:hypothetical protein THAOC_33267 [Thalassiosira oceanica]|eukprot:EJK47976.1 hypothetical protein THAOC_33267 [Thalassiosira oceanica]
MQNEEASGGVVSTGAADLKRSNQNSKCKPGFNSRFEYYCCYLLFGPDNGLRCGIKFDTKELMCLRDDLLPPWPLVLLCAIYQNNSLLAWRLGTWRTMTGLVTRYRNQRIPPCTLAPEDVWTELHCSLLAALPLTLCSHSSEKIQRTIDKEVRPSKEIPPTNPSPPEATSLFQVQKRVALDQGVAKVIRGACGMNPGVRLAFVSASPSANRISRRDRPGRLDHAQLDERIIAAYRRALSVRLACQEAGCDAEGDNESACLNYGLYCRGRTTSRGQWKF